MTEGSWSLSLTRGTWKIWREDTEPRVPASPMRAGGSAAQGWQQVTDGPVYGVEAR